MNPDNRCPFWRKVNAGLPTCMANTYLSSPQMTHMYIELRKSSHEKHGHFKRCPSCLAMSEFLQRDLPLWSQNTHELIRVQYFAVTLCMGIQFFVTPSWMACNGDCDAFPERKAEYRLKLTTGNVQNNCPHTTISVDRSWCVQQSRCTWRTYILMSRWLLH